MTGPLPHGARTAPAPVGVVRLPPQRAQVLGQLYSAAAVLFAVSGMIPLFVVDGEDASSSSASYSLWRGVFEFGESISLLGGLFTLLMAGVLVTAALRAAVTVALPGVLVALALVGGIVLSLSPQQPRDTSFGVGMNLLVALCAVVVVTAATHLVLATRRAAPRFS